MRRKRLRRLSRLEPPLSAACALAFRHGLIVADPQHRMTWAVNFRDATCNPGTL